MSWTAPKTWTASVPTVADFNQYIRDNQEYLKDPPNAQYAANEVADYTTTSATFVDVDGTNFALQVTLDVPGDVLVGFHGAIKNTAGVTHFEIAVDGVVHAGNDGVTGQQATASPAPGVAVSFVRRITGLSAATHTFKLQWKTSGGSQATLYAGAGTANGDVHPQFWVVANN